MSHKVRNHFAVAAVGAIACSLAFQPIASAAQSPVTEDAGDLSVVTGSATEGRISGVDRFGTAVSASKAYTGSGDTVILANYLAWSDTLAATPLADALDAPVLYTYADKLEAKTIAELKRLKAENDGVLNVMLVGGVGVITPAVAAELEAMDITVDQIGGKSRYDTALLLAAEVVGYYEANTSLTEARINIANVKKAEAEYQKALAAWEASRAVTSAAWTVALSAIDDVEAAQKVLTDLISGLVTVPPATIDIDGVPYTITSLNDYNNFLVGFQNRVSDLQVAEEFINDRLFEYVRDASPADFQNDSWNNDVVDHFGTQTFTIVLSSGSKTGTLAQHAASTPVLSEVLPAPAANTPVKGVEALAASLLADAEDNVTDYQSKFAAVVAQLNDIEDAIANNAALQRKIGDAQRVVEAKELALVDALAKYNDARAKEEAAKGEFVLATANRPKGDGMQHAQNRYDAALNAILKLGKKYPAFLATGLDFADALAAGPAAADEAGVVLLTEGNRMAAATQRYLDSGPTIVGVGGPAATAGGAKVSVKYVGKDRYQTATKLAAAYFQNNAEVGLASGVVSADAVIAGALMANVDGTLVLTDPTTLPDYTRQFLSFQVDNPRLVTFGGTGAISQGVKAAAEQALVD